MLKRIEWCTIVAVKVKKPCISVKTKETSKTEKFPFQTRIFEKKDAHA